MDKGIEALIAHMKSAALKATPGPWRRTSTRFSGITHGPFSFTKEDVLGYFSEKCNAEFVSECDPKNVLALIATLEQVHQECQAIEQKLIKAAVYIETLESEPRKTNLKQLNEIAELKRTCEELETASIKPVNMPDAYAIRPGHPINEDERSVMIPKDGGNWYSRLDIEHALRVAGVRFEGGE